MNTTSISIIVILLILLVISIRLSLALARRSVCTVINTFRQNGANRPDRSVPLESIGLRTTIPILELRGLRDYKPWAVRTLIQAGIIRATPLDTFYLSEAELEQKPNISCPVKSK